jgi:hypothetical protein
MGKKSNNFYISSHYFIPVHQGPARRPASSCPNHALKKPLCFTAKQSISISPDGVRGDVCAPAPHNMQNRTHLWRWHSTNLVPYNTCSDGPKWDRRHGARALMYGLRTATNRWSPHWFQSATDCSFAGSHTSSFHKLLEGQTTTFRRGK